ncbi:hypothetical protein [Chromobacterium sphagni]|uniref:hypothetical protein n=1 Tax=Chromobacterium sphagni TaxID=1903179 RepID=UPI0019D3614E|nr:hypothetical protein [Chromobacterium sphagni]
MRLPDKQIQPADKQLPPQDHDLAFDGFQFVYLVVSHRAGWVSIGINLMPRQPLQLALRLLPSTQLTARRRRWTPHN